MRKSRICVLGAAAVIGAALTTTGASAAMASPLLPNPNTTVTFTVTNGALTIDAPTDVALAGATVDTVTAPSLPGTTVSGTNGPTTVVDNRAALDASWTATVSSSDFTTGAGTTPETIPALGTTTYDPGTITDGTGDTAAAVDATGTVPFALDNGGVDVVTNSGSGDNTAVWDATIAVAIPATAVEGAYTGTLVTSVG
jgi:hypothetical protein